MYGFESVCVLSYCPLVLLPCFESRFYSIIVRVPWYVLLMEHYITLTGTTLQIFPVLFLFLRVCLALCYLSDHMFVQVFNSKDKSLVVPCLL